MAVAKSIAQQAVALFMAGDIDEARQILEIGQAIVEERERATGGGRVLGRGAGTGPVGVVNRRKPRRPKLAPAVSAAEPPVAPEVSTTPAQAAQAPQPAAMPAPRRRGRPPIVRPSTEAPVASAASVAAVNELPPQGDPDEDEA